MEENDGNGTMRRTNRARRKQKGPSPISHLIVNLYMRRFILACKAPGYGDGDPAAGVGHQVGQRIEAAQAQAQAQAHAQGALRQHIDEAGRTAAQPVEEVVDHRRGTLSDSVVSEARQGPPLAASRRLSRAHRVSVQ